MATPSRITIQLRQESLFELVNKLDEGLLKIPEHQRAFVWSNAKGELLMESLMEGLPLPSILVSASRGDPYETLEDGLQRLTTVSRCRKDQIKIPSSDGTLRKFSELSQIERERLESYQITVICYKNATQEQRIRIFDRFQNGAALTTGERYHAIASLSPLVTYVKQTIMTKGQGLHDRGSEVWGMRGGEDKKRKDLTSAVALVLGLAHGPEEITKKYDYIVEHNLLTKPFDEAGVTKDLERIIEIYEEVDRLKPIIGRKNKNDQWNLGTTLGYIAYSLSHAIRMKHESNPVKIPKFQDVYKPNSLAKQPEVWAKLKKGWIDFLIKVREDRQILHRTLHADVAAARFWELKRWKTGYLRVFEPTNPILPICSLAEENDSEETDSED
jgi:hypothetical protein